MVDRERENSSMRGRNEMKWTTNICRFYENKFTEEWRAEERPQLNRVEDLVLNLVGWRIPLMTTISACVEWNVARQYSALQY